MSALWEVGGDVTRVLAVCTGNVCRSPLVEALLQEGFDAVVPGAFAVRSAGTHPLVGSAPTPEIQELAERLGVSVSGIRAREVVEAEVHDADLVLALDRGHRAAIVERVPRALKKTFTLRELARLLPQVPVERDAWPQQRWQSAVVWASRRRRAVPAGPDADDVVDPFQQPEPVLWEMAGQLVPAVDALLQWERRAGGGGAGPRE
jgi:protein-tyrosine phosphatase